MQVRMFAGWQFTDQDASSQEFEAIGYAAGVPMGGELSSAPAGAAPRFMIRAVKGPMDHNLDRVQVVKGWQVDGQEAQEKIFNVGDMVEHMDGTTGQIVRRGTNYVSFESDGLIKKAWLYDIQMSEEPRIPRKKGQPAGSDKHSDLYTDENPKGTIKGLGFKDTETASASVSKIKNSGKTHAHKIQAAVAMEQRAKEMGKSAEAAIYRKYINQMKEKTKEMNKESLMDTLEKKMKKKERYKKKRKRNKKI